MLFTIGAAAYSNDELCEMARQFCKARGDYLPEYFWVDREAGNEVVIHLYDFIRDNAESGHMATSDWYTVDRYTGKGTDFPGRAIDISPYAPSKPTTGNSEFTIQNGVLIKYNGSGGDVVVPSGVTEIAFEAFWNLELTSISSPSSVTDIGTMAFSMIDGSLDRGIIPGLTIHGATGSYAKR